MTRLKIKKLIFQSPYLTNSWICWIPITFLNCISKEFLTVVFRNSMKNNAEFFRALTVWHTTIYHFPMVFTKIKFKYHFIEFFLLRQAQFRSPQHSFVVVYLLRRAWLPDRIIKSTPTHQSSSYKHAFQFVFSDFHAPNLTLTFSSLYHVSDNIIYVLFSKLWAILEITYFSSPRFLWPFFQVLIVMVEAPLARLLWLGSFGTGSFNYQWKLTLLANNLRCSSTS